MTQKLLSVRDLKTYFYTDDGVIPAVDGISFDLHKGGTIGIVGESGCGKSVTSLSIMRLIPNPPGKIEGGTIEFEGQNLLQLSEAEMRHIRGNEISMIFQEPMTSLSPVHTIGNQIVESILLHQELDQKAARAVAAEMLERVGIKEAKKRLDDYPHSFSGGMRQRAMIAMALCCEPKLLIADEPTTALDVTIQAQILDLMRDLQDEFGMAIMMITHNLGVVANVADDVVVMYLGQVVEAAPVESLFANPSHPYTKALLRSIPRLGKKRKEQLASIEGAVPDAYNIPPGCPFHPRCSLFQPGLCDQSQPPIVKVGSGHTVRCFLASEVN